MADTAYPDGPVYVVGEGVSSVLWESISVDRSATATPIPFFTISGSEDASRDGDIPLYHQLALAVLRGDTGAALLLADLVQEQHTGAASELQAEVKRRVEAAVRGQIDICARMAECFPTPAHAPLGVRDAIEQWGRELANAIRSCKHQ